MNPSSQTKREEIRWEFETARMKFHTVLGSLSEQDFKNQSLNPGWSNGEVLAHVTFGFIVINVLLPMARLWGKLPKSSSKWFAWLLNSFTGIFNWFNMIGARGQGKVFTYQRIGKIYDRVYFSLLKKIDSIKDDEWEHGMYYPTEWDSTFDDFMTLDKLFRYPIRHLNFHLQQI
ncbi:MAG: DinB family protein, partial [Dehalobacter sp.]|nr:DinB family protein [Dehalobacter sp.]